MLTKSVILKIKLAFSLIYDKAYGVRPGHKNIRTANPETKHDVFSLRVPSRDHVFRVDLVLRLSSWESSNGSGPVLTCDAVSAF